MKKGIKCIILVGLPASGKSTWALDYLRRNSNTVRINRDDLRFMLRNQGTVEPNIEDLITEVQESLIMRALKRKQNLIIDNTNLKAHYIQRIIDLVHYQADVEFMLFDVPLAKCIERDKQRDKPVGEQAIRKMNESFVILKDSFVFQNIAQKPEYLNRFRAIPYKGGLPEAVIFDIDGTLALLGKRSPYNAQKVDIDDPNEVVVEHVNFHLSKGRKIILLSGRDEEAREKTVYWLNFYNINYDYLYMRSSMDFRKDSIIKRELYEKHIKDRFNIKCVYDDRLQVVQMWYEIGLFVFNVNQGNKEF